MTQKYECSFGMLKHEMFLNNLERSAGVLIVCMFPYPYYYHYKDGWLLSQIWMGLTTGPN